MAAAAVYPSPPAPRASGRRECARFAPQVGLAFGVWRLAGARSVAGRPVVRETAAVGPLGRLPCAARARGVPQNSLRSLRSLRPNRLRQVRGGNALRAPPQALRCSAPHTRARPATLRLSGSVRANGFAASGVPRARAVPVPSSARRCSAKTYTSTRSMPPSLARATYSGIQSSPRMRLAISTTM